MYANSLSGPFVMDDVASIVENTHIREWWRLSGLLFPERELPVAGRPVVNASFALNYALGGLDVGGYHAWNIAVHLGCALALFGIVHRTLLRPDLAARFNAKPVDLAFAVALLWTLHPLNTEAVDYLTQRTETMMALFYLLTLYASIRSAGASAWNGWPIVAVLSCVLGMGSKESMVTAPVMVVLYDRVFVFRSIAQAVRSRARLYAGLAATWLVLAGMLWSGPRIHSAGFSTAVSPWTYLLNQAEMITRYLWLAVWPRALVVNYGWPRALTLADVWPQAIFLLALLGATIVALRRSPPIGFLGAWFFMTLAPTSSIIPIATEVGAERRMYLPLIPLVVLAVVGGYLCWSLAERLRVRGPARETSAAGWLVFLGVSVMLGLGTVDRNREYGSAVRLAETALERFPTGVAHHTLAVELLAVGRSDEAMHHLRQAVPKRHALTRRWAGSCSGKASWTRRLTR